MLAVRARVRLLGLRRQLQATQRPSWNYRAEDGGGIILDMLCHWRYVLDHVFGAVRSPDLPRRNTHHRAF
jgi:predicted dehydrogenase